MMHVFISCTKKEITKFLTKCGCVSLDVINVDLEDTKNEVEITHVYLDSIENNGFQKVTQFDTESGPFYEVSII
jgi:hypothetical protein